MTKDNLDVTEAVARLETACARAEYEFPLLAAPDGTVAVPFADLRALLSMQSAREPKPASPPTGDVEEYVRYWLACHGCSPSDKSVADLLAALATLQPADPVEPKGGFAYFNEDTGMEWSRNHPVESGEVPDATEIEAMTLGEFRHRWPADPVEPKVSSDVDDITCPQHFDPYCHACQAALLPTLRASDPSRELVEALVAHNDALRSVSSVTGRGGLATNWPTFRAMVERTLEKYHSVTNEARAALAQGQSR